MRILLLLILCWIPGFAAATLAVGEPAPPLEATQLDGAHFSLAANRGKIVIVNFWATWCAPCREEMPVLDAFYKKHQAEGVEVIAISADDPADRKLVNEVMAAFSFPAAMRDDAKYAGYGWLRHIPLTFVIDRQGILRRDAWHAAPKIDAASLDAEVLPLLAAPAAPPSELESSTH
jgi:thiol-disulfide isomerase/thioredoxin